MIQDTALFMFGLQGKTLNKQEKQWLNHPLTAGVILFTRNYESPEQIKAFIQTIRETATQDILIAVDHEGGRVQRFREGFTQIPAMATLGKHYDNSYTDGLQAARDTAYVMAYEIAACDIDFSFAPVLDVQTDFSQIIGDRGFHADVQQIAPIAQAFYQGMRDAGTIGVGKHFPGHGNVVADSHLELPVCETDFTTLAATDLPPFEALINDGIEGIMPAHILYSQVDGMPAGFSNFWLQYVLREQLGFDGCIISDDLDMAGAAAFGDIRERIALAAKNCDLILLCNHHEHMQIAFETQAITACKKSQKRLQSLTRRKDSLSADAYHAALTRLKKTHII